MGGGVWNKAGVETVRAVVDGCGYLEEEEDVDASLLEWWSKLFTRRETKGACCTVMDGLPMNLFFASA